MSEVPLHRFRAKREHLGRVQGLLPESQGHNLALTVLYVPYSLGGDKDTPRGCGGEEREGSSSSLCLSSLELSDTQVYEP